MADEYLPSNMNLQYLTQGTPKNKAKTERLRQFHQNICSVRNKITCEAETEPEAVTRISK